MLQFMFPNLWSVQKHNISGHPPPDTPQKKNQKTHLGDPKIYQVEGIDIPKQQVQ